MDKLFEHNPGLPSRFPTKLVFEDYSPEELQEILKALMLNKPLGNKPNPPDPSPQPKPSSINMGRGLAQIRCG